MVRIWYVEFTSYNGQAKKKERDKRKQDKRKPSLVKKRRKQKFGTIEEPTVESRSFQNAKNNFFGEISEIPKNTHRECCKEGSHQISLN